MPEGRAMRRRAGALALLLAAASPALADVRSESQLRQFVEMLDAAAEWTARADLIRSDGDDTIAEGLVVSRQAPDVTIRVESLRLGDLDEQSDGGGFSASEIEATGIAVDSEFVEYGIPSAVAAQVSMPTFAGLEFDVRRLMSSASRYYSVAARGELGEVSVPEATIVTEQVAPGETEPVTSRMVYRNLRFSGMQAGVIGSQTVGPVTMEIGTPGRDAAQVTIEQVVAEQIDLGAAARIFDETQYENGRGDGVWRPIVARVGYSGFSAAGPDSATFQLKEVAIEDIEGRQPEEPFTSDLDRLLDPAVSDEMEPELILEAVTNMYSAWRLGTMRVVDIAADAPAASTAFSLDGITLSGLSSDGIESFLLQGLEGKGPGGFASLGSFELSGVVFPGLEALMQFAALESDAPAAEHEATLRSAFAALPRLSHMGLHDMAGGLSEATAVRLGSFTLDLSDWNDFWAESTQMRIEGLDVPRSLVELNPQAGQMMDQLGYERLVLGMSIEDRWSPDAGSDDATLTFSMQDAGEIALSYSLTGVTMDWVSRASAAAARAADPNAAFMRMLADLGLTSATLKVTDRSMLDRGFSVAAKMQGLSVEGPAYREQMRGALPFLLSAAVPAALSKLLSAPLQQFLAGGQTLIAELAPPQPIPIPELLEAAQGDPMTLPSRLGIQVRTEAP